jgi:outer membrane murein-binding lipoprotein Lpp
MRTKLAVLVAAGLLAGCVSKSKYDQLAMQQQQLSQERDSLQADVQSTKDMLANVDSALAAVKGLAVAPTAAATGDHPESSEAAYRAVLLGKIRDVISRLDSAEKQVAHERARLSSATVAERHLRAQLDTLQRNLADMKTAAEQQEATIEQQKTQIQTLAARTDTLSQQAADLTSRNAALSDTVTNLVNEENTVYYAVGTKDDLIKRGILVSEGSKFLVFGGHTLQPARNLNPAQFQRLDLRTDTVLTVPDPAKEYKIVTRQNPQYLAQAVQSDGKVKGDLHITSPAFWDNGRYLILVQD